MKGFGTVSSGSKKETRWSHGPPLREEKAINKVHKLLLECARIIDYCLFNPTVEGAEIVEPHKKQLRSATAYFQ